MMAMKYLQKIFTGIFLLLFLFSELSAQCTGGTATGSITPTLAWQTTSTANINGGDYKTFAATAGNIYYFSFCAADGGSSTYDTQISILTNAGVGVGAGGYNDDNCGLQSYVAWTCVTTGTYRVLVNRFSCALQTALGNLAYKYSAALTCPSGLGSGVTNVSSLPYSSGAGTTCGAGNDITASNSLVCGSTSYYGGEDRVWIFTPAISGTVTITLTSSGTWTGLMLYRGCPINGQGGVCVDFAQSSTGNKTLSVCLQGGVAYYLIMDSYPSPTCNPYSDLTISAPVAAGGCSVGTGLTNIALPYTSTGRTTCGKINDQTASNTITCGSTLYTTAEDEVFSFVPSISGTITVSLTSASSWVGITLFDGCPMTSSCSGTPGVCVAFEQSSAGSQSMCVNVVAGKTYYLVVDQFASPTCIPSYNINITAPSGVAAGTTCANPYIIASLPISLNNETTACMGNDYNNATAGSCGTFYESGEDKVYRFTATGAQCIAINITQASTNYIGYTVYNGCPGAGGVCVGSNGGANAGALAGSVVLPGAGTYYIIIDTWAPPNNATYDISIVSLGGGAANDLPCNAVLIPVGIAMPGSNYCSGGGGEPAAPSCWITPNTLNTVWFRAICPASGQLRIRTSAGSLNNTQIAVYSGTCGASMTLMGCNDDMPPCGTTTNAMSDLLLTGLTSGNTYYISVDGYAGLTGTFSVAVSDGALPLPPAPGQECSTPNPVCNTTINVGDPGYQAFGTGCDFSGGGTNCLLSGERGSSWYTINIGAAGNLEFNLVPNDYVGGLAGDETDYDFALWKMKDGPSNTTVNTCATISGGAAPIRCDYDFLGVTGLYGAAANTAFPAYAPDFNSAYEARLPVQTGDIYLLIVSNFQNSTSGFNLTFSGASPINYAPGATSVLWTGGIDNDWFKPGNWGGCGIPSCATDAIIVPASANQPIINAAGAAVKSLNISTGATLTVNAGFALQVCENLTNSGGLTASPTSTVLFNNAAVNQNITGNFVGANKFGNLTITKTGGIVSLNNDADVGGAFTISNATSTINANGRYHKVAGNFTNSGTYTPGANGTLELNGTAAQTYFNAGTINNLNMQHTGTGVTLNSNCILGTLGVLSLNAGRIITTPSYEVSVTNRSTAASTAGNINSFVQGFLRRYINPTGAYDFPVGHQVAGYQRANVNFIIATTIDNLRSTFNTYASLPGPLMLSECGATYSQNALNNGYWTITASNNPTSGNYNMTLYNLNYSNAGSGFTVMKNNGSGWGLWNGTCIVSSVTAVQRNNMNGFSDFGVAQSPTPLPVTWLGVSAIAIEKNILVTWQTAEEINNDYYTIERSTDGKNFEPIVTIEPVSPTNNIFSYSFEDKNVLPSTIYYYKIRQTDFNGSIDYSKTVSAKTGNGNYDFTIQPNPFNTSFVIEYYTEESAYVKIELLNKLGQTLKLLDAGKKEKGFNTLSIGERSMFLTKGVYTLKLTIDGVVYSKLIFKTE